MTWETRSADFIVGDRVQYKIGSSLHEGTIEGFQGTHFRRAWIIWDEKDSSLPEYVDLRKLNKESEIKR